MKGVPIVVGMNVKLFPRANLMPVSYYVAIRLSAEVLAMVGPSFYRLCKFKQNKSKKAKKQQAKTETNIKTKIKQNNVR
jgi:hypothetical protein